MLNRQLKRSIEHLILDKWNSDFCGFIGLNEFSLVYDKEPICMCLTFGDRFNHVEDLHFKYQSLDTIDISTIQSNNIPSLLQIFYAKTGKRIIL